MELVFLSLGLMLTIMVGFFVVPMIRALNNDEDGSK